MTDQYANHGANLRPDPADRAGLVTKLRELSRSELAAYCDGVLSAAALYRLDELVAALRAVIQPEPMAEVIDLRPPCDRCGQQIEYADKGRPRKRHIVCPVDPDRPGAVTSMEPRRPVVAGRRAA